MSSFHHGVMEIDVVTKPSASLRFQGADTKKEVFSQCDKKKRITFVIASLAFALQ